MDLPTLPTYLPGFLSPRSVYSPLTLESRPPQLTRQTYIHAIDDRLPDGLSTYISRNTLLRCLIRLSNSYTCPIGAAWRRRDGQIA